MFVSIMCGVINEVTRQSPVPAARTVRGTRTEPVAARPRRERRATPRTTALPDRYRILAESFKHAAGFHG